MIAWDALFRIMRIRKKGERLEAYKKWRHDFLLVCQANYQFGETDVLMAESSEAQKGLVRSMLKSRLLEELSKNDAAFSIEESVNSLTGNRHWLAKLAIIKGVDDASWDWLDSKKRRTRNNQYTFTYADTSSTMSDRHWLFGPDEVYGDEVGGGEQEGT